ncbi:NUDIX domain-containing protein [Streptomyces cacaoi]|uniref:NUDIX domain-containing protein n=1 Tax=Streptomyces cacaoi TaxID=1898 RepID=UPI003322D404
MQPVSGTPAASTVPRTPPSGIPAVPRTPAPPDRAEEPYDADLAGYLAAHPAPAAAVDAVIRDERGRILVVDPVYKDGWDLPGGMVDDEGLVDGLLREIREELGPVPARAGRLLAVDDVPAAVYGRALVACVYTVRLPLPVTVDDLVLQRDELRAAAFLPEEAALARLPRRLRRRTAAALEAERGAHTAQLHDGRPVPLDPRDRWALLPSPAVYAAVLHEDGRGRVLLVRAGTDGPDERGDGAAEAPGGGLVLPGGPLTAAETPARGAARAAARALGTRPAPVGRLLAVDGVPAPPGGRALTAHLFAADPAHPTAVPDQPATDPAHPATDPGSASGAFGPTGADEAATVPGTGRKDGPEGPEGPEDEPSTEPRSDAEAEVGPDAEPRSTAGPEAGAPGGSGAVRAVWVEAREAAALLPDWQAPLLRHGLRALALGTVAQLEGGVPQPGTAAGAPPRAQRGGGTPE